MNRSDPNVFVEDQQQARTVTDRFASGTVSTRRHPEVFVEAKLLPR